MKDSTKCWFNETIVPQEMLKGAKGEIQGWTRLEDTDHGKVIGKFLDNIKKQGLAKSAKFKLRLIDIGCGAAEVSRVFKKKIDSYIGVDLPHIIEKVAKQLNPKEEYFQLNINSAKELKFITKNDTILLNSLLSEVEDPLDELSKILKQKPQFIIIHRQDFTEEPTHLEVYKSYGGYETTNSFINFDSFIELVEYWGYVIKEECKSMSGNSGSIVLARKK